MQCSVCFEPFNKSKNLKVDCKGCNGDEYACRKCCKDYIIKTSQQDPSCMFCRSVWDREFMNSYLTKKFVTKDLKEYSENLLFERQVSLLPETQQAAATEKEIRSYNKRLEEAQSELNRLRKALHDQNNIIRSINMSWDNNS